MAHENVRFQNEMDSVKEEPQQTKNDAVMENPGVTVREEFGVKLDGEPGVEVKEKTGVNVEVDVGCVAEVEDHSALGWDEKEKASDWGRIEPYSEARAESAGETSQLTKLESELSEAKELIKKTADKLTVIQKKSELLLDSESRLMDTVGRYEERMGVMQAENDCLRTEVDQVEKLKTEVAMLKESLQKMEKKNKVSELANAEKSEQLELRQAEIRRTISLFEDAEIESEARAILSSGQMSASSNSVSEMALESQLNVERKRRLKLSKELEETNKNNQQLKDKLTASEEQIETSKLDNELLKTVELGLEPDAVKENAQESDDTKTANSPVKREYCDEDVTACIYVHCPTVSPHTSSSEDDQRRMKELDVEISNLKGESNHLPELEAREGALKAKIKKANELASRHKGSALQTRTELDTTTILLPEEKKQLEQLQASNELLLDSESRLMDIVRSYEERMEKFEADEAAQLARKEELETENAELREEVAKLEQYREVGVLLRAEEQKIESLETENRALKAQVNNLKCENKSLTEAWEGCIKKNEKLSAELSVIENQLAEEKIKAEAQESVERTKQRPPSKP